MSDSSKLKEIVETIQYLHKLSVTNNGLKLLWNKCEALDPITVAGLLHNKPIVNFIKRTLKKRYKHKFTDEEVEHSLDRVIYEPIQLDNVRQVTVRKRKKNNSDNDSADKQPEKETDIVNSDNNITTN